MTIPKDPNNAINERMWFVKARLHGFSPNPLLQQEILSNQKDLQEKTHQIAQLILEKNQTLVQMADDVEKEMGSVDFLKAGQFQQENLAKTVEKLSTINARMTEELTTAEKQLSVITKEKEELTEQLRSLKHGYDSSKGKNYSFQGPLNQIGHAMCKTAANKGEK